MASKRITTSVELPECPVCMEIMKAPIFNCQSGHSLCHSCTTTLRPAICPICRHPMTQMRNLHLEEIISNAKLPCPNKDAGCIFKVSIGNDNHVNECIFRRMRCPLGVVNGKCSWTGTINEMMEHFKERHPMNCNVSVDSEVELNNINFKEDDRYFYLVPNGKLLFILTLKIDTIEKMAYWTVQHIGTKAVAGQYIYEIHLTSKLDNRRKVVFIEHCFSDSIKVEEIFQQGKCAIVPINMVKHYIQGKSLAFKFFLKKFTTQPKSSGGKGETSGHGDVKKSDLPNQKGSQDPYAGNRPKPGPKAKTETGPKKKVK